LAELEQAQESYHSNNSFTDSDDDDDDDDDDDACDGDEYGSAVVDFGSQLAPLFGGVMTHLLSK